MKDDTDAACVVGVTSKEVGAEPATSVPIVWNVLLTERLCDEEIAGCPETKLPETNVEGTSAWLESLAGRPDVNEDAAKPEGVKLMLA